MIRTLNLEIGINEMGTGQTETKKINGYLLLVSFPRTELMYNSFLYLFPKAMPQLKFIIPKKEVNVFRIKMDTADDMGNKGAQLEDVPINDKLIVGFRNMVPNTTMDVTILYEDGK